jgi:hypothetical protein
MNLDNPNQETRLVVSCPPVMHPPRDGFRLAGCYGTWISVPAHTKIEDLSRYFIVRPYGAPPPESRVEPKTLTVAGSRGGTYTVRLRENGQTTCTCPGFGYRRTCKHLTLLSA